MPRGPRTIEDRLVNAIHQVGPALGATTFAPYPGWGELRAALEENGIRPRPGPRFSEVGITISRPDRDRWIVGRATFDLEAAQVKEDHYEVRLHSEPPTFLPRLRGGLEKRDARYRGTHHGAKPYFFEDLD